MGKKESYIFGVHPLLEAFESGKKIEKVMIRVGGESPSLRRIENICRERGITLQFVPLERLNRVTKSNHQGVIGYLPKIEYSTLDQLVEEKGEGKIPLIIILDGITDVRNFGAIVRSAETFGVQGIIQLSKGSANINADAIKASAGALLRVKVCKVVNIREAVFFLRESGYQIISSSSKASESIATITPKRATALILGSEERGVSRSALQLSDSVVKIPLLGKIGSLNVSAAASIMLYELSKGWSE
ncbi:MAG: 23S rRNA (guanosine(2251)-2'-O)-methyltransferase RlmB [Bacteroidales bacterium]